MKDYSIDSKTGYLTPDVLCTDRFKFTAEQKTCFLDIFTETGNFTKAAKLVGITRETVTKHFEGDVAFYKAYQAAIDQLCDEMEENVVRMAKKTPVAAFAFLKAYRKGVWSDGKGQPTDKAHEKLKNLLEEIKKEDK